jgi:DNA repair protein RadC
MSITNWPAAERPRERLMAFGAAALSDAELLAIFLRVGIAGKSAVELARDLLSHFEGDLARLMSAPANTLIELPGMGIAKATQFAAILELARRVISVDLSARPIFNSPDQVRDWLQLRIATQPHEVMMALWLNQANELIATEELSKGTLTQATVHSREVVKSALAHNAAAVILAHNHPSGNLTPSEADIGLTRTLKRALALVDVRLLDHFIVGPGSRPDSMAERGLVGD